MGVISNLVRETQMLPAITREQLSVIQRFQPALYINDITKPHKALWEFNCHQIINNERVYVWMSEEGRVIATAYEEPRQRTGDYSDSLKRKGIGIMRDDWTHWLNLGRDTTTIEDEWGLHSLGIDLHEKVQTWCIEQVKNRRWDRGSDYYGRSWDHIDPEFRCPVCGQPKPQPCDHTRLSNDVVSIIRTST